MIRRFAFMFIVLLGPVLSAAPPAQSELPRSDLARMRPDERESLEKLLGVGFPGLGAKTTILAGTRDQVESFAGRVVIVQAWAFNDVLAQKQLARIDETIDGLEDVLLLAIHPADEPEKINRALERRKLPGVIVHDVQDAFAKPLGLTSRGANLIVDRHGVIRYVGIDPSAIRALVLELLSETPDPGKKPQIDVEQFAVIAAQAAELRASLDAAWASGDLRQAERVLEDIWATDAATALQLSRDLFASRSSIQSVLGLSQIAAHASAEDIFELASTLNERTNRIELSILVRALGSREIEDPEAVLAPFLQSSQVYVRQAALYALADLAGPESIGLFVDELRSAPVATDNWGVNERDRLMNTLFGVAYKLSQLRGLTGRDYAHWLEVYRQDPEQARLIAERSIRDESGNPLTVQFSSDTFQTYPGFDLAFRLLTSSPEAIDQSMPARFVAAIEQARESAAPVLGRVYVAPIRVYIADARGFSSLAGNSYMAGKAEVNKLYVLYDSVQGTTNRFVHEYAHILHQAMYERQPRWLSEGFAESVAADDHTWNLSRVASMNIQKGVDDGVFSRLASWSDSASSGDKEAENYRLAHLAVDFLRFGPFPAGDTRLQMLMATLSTGRGERAALMDLYGLDARQLDEEVRRWLQSP